MSTDDTADRLMTSITARALVEQAKGVLVWRLDVGPDTAGEVLLCWAGDAGVDIAVMADKLVNVVCRPGHPRSEELRLIRLLEENLQRHERDT